MILLKILVKYRICIVKGCVNFSHLLCGISPGLLLALELLDGRALGDVVLHDVLVVPEE